MVYIIILNWNGWADTIECLESVFRIDYPNFRVIVCDNDSYDGSLEYIKAWAEGRLDVFVPKNNRLRHFSFPPISKPLSYIEYNRMQAELGGKSDDSDNRLVLIQTGGNLGFAGGNNVGLRYIMKKGHFQYVWLLNSDTVVDPDALKYLIKETEDNRKKGQKVGIVGSKLLFYEETNIIQGVGGKYNKWFSVSNHIGMFEKDKGQYDSSNIDFDYVIGASMLTNRDFLNEVGLMEEDYFHFYEDLDWALRGKRKGWNLGYCWASKVYHKGGATFGSFYIGREKNILVDFFSLKNRIVFTKKFYPSYLLTVYLGFLFVLLNRARRGQFDSIKMILDILTPGESTWVKYCS